MKLIKTEDAVGQVLCHDLTRIVPGEFKGPQFRKGHIVTPEDIPMLLSMTGGSLACTVRSVTRGRLSASVLLLPDGGGTDAMLCAELPRDAAIAPGDTVRIAIRPGQVLYL